MGVIQNIFDLISTVIVLIVSNALFQIRRLAGFDGERKALSSMENSSNTAEASGASSRKVQTSLNRSKMPQLVDDAIAEEKIKEMSKNSNKLKNENDHMEMMHDELSPAFLPPSSSRKKSYPDKWLVYDVTYGLIEKTKLDEADLDLSHEQGEHESAVSNIIHSEISSSSSICSTQDASRVSS